MYRIIALVFSLIVSPIASAQDALNTGKIDSIFVNVSNERSNFTVFDSRVTETLTGAVLFGVLGAAVNSSINAGEDSDKTDVYRENASKLDLASIVEDAIIARLTKKEILCTQTKNDASHALNVQVRDWGLIRENFESALMVTFIRLEIEMTSGKKIVWDTKLNDNAKRRAILEEFTFEMLQADIEKLAEKAGKRVANEIIYR